MCIVQLYMYVHADINLEKENCCNTLKQNVNVQCMGKCMISNFDVIVVKFIHS